MDQILQNGMGQKEAQLAQIRADCRSEKERLAQQDALESSMSPSAPGDWTGSYNKWDMWEDKEEIQNNISAKQEQEVSKE